MKNVVLVIAVAMMVSLAGCQEIRNEQVGTGVGAVIGGVLGAQLGGGSGQLAAVAAGALLGAYLGGNVGRTMDEGDRVRTQQTLEATPTGQHSSWENPDSGNRYDVTPTRTRQDGDRPCRDYMTDAWIDGQRETVRGTACRESDGIWQVI
jgi:surface antigen